MNRTMVSSLVLLVALCMTGSFAFHDYTGEDNVFPPIPPLDPLVQPAHGGVEPPYRIRAPLWTVSKLGIHFISGVNASTVADVPAHDCYAELGTQYENVSYSGGPVTTVKTVGPVWSLELVPGLEPACAGPGHAFITFDPPKPAWGQPFHVVVHTTSANGNPMPCTGSDVVLDWLKYPQACVNWVQAQLEETPVQSIFFKPGRVVLQDGNATAGCRSQELTYVCSGCYELVSSVTDQTVTVGEPDPPLTTLGLPDSGLEDHPGNDTHPNTNQNLDPDVNTAEHGFYEGVSGRSAASRAGRLVDRLPRRVGGLPTTTEASRERATAATTKRHHVVLPQDAAGFLLSAYRAQEAELALGDARCDGASCCLLAFDCVQQLAGNIDEEDPSQDAEWRETDHSAPKGLGAENACELCPYPVCAFGYFYDSLTALCAKYRSSVSAPVFHEAYTSLRDCVSDYSRSAEGWCVRPLQRAFSSCLLASGQ